MKTNWDDTRKIVYRDVWGDTASHVQQIYSDDIYLAVREICNWQIMEQIDSQFLPAVADSIKDI